MNDHDPAENPFIEPTAAFTEAPESSLTSLLHQAEDFIRRHPLATALTTLGLGCAIGVAAHELLNPPPKTNKQRAMDLLEDIQGRLADFMEPVSERASQLAEDGLSAMKSGLHSAAGSGSKAVNRIRHLFS